MWQTYTGDGSKGPFTFTFGASNVNQILCIVSTGYGDMTLNGADFSVTLNKDQDNNPGGIVTLDQVLPIGHYLTVGLVGQIVQTPNSVERRKGARSDVVCRHLKSIEDQYRESVFKTEKIYTDCADKLDDFTESEKKVITDKLDKVNSDIDSMKTESEGRLSALETSVTNTENNINQQIENTKANVDNKLLVIKQAIEVNGQNIQKNKENIAANDTAIKANLATIESHTKSLSSLDGRVTTNESDIDSLEERATTLESTTADHESRIKANETELANHELRINDIEVNTDVGQLTTRIQAIESKNTEQDETISINKTNTDKAIADEIKARQDSDSALGERIDTVETKDSEQDTHLGTIDTHLGTIDTHLGTIDTHLGTIDDKNTTQDEALESTKTDLTKAIANLSTKIEDVKNNITSGLDLLTVLIMPLGVDETENQFRYLNGQVIMQDQFADFTSKLKARMTLYPSVFTTEENWQAEKTNSKLGQCGKFVVDDDAGTIRLPCVVNVNGLSDLTQTGVIKAESLPNITSGTDWTNTTAGNLTNAINSAPINDGCFVGKSTGGHGIANNQFTISWSRFDANNSSSTYQDNAPVQQEAIQYPYVIVVGTKSKKASEPVNNYQVNNVYSFGMSQYFKGTMNNNSWLRSNGQWNNGTTYTDFYAWLVEHLNANDDGFKLSTAEDITDYDYVINTTDRTFKLPIKNGQEGVFASGVKGNGITVGFTDGVENYGFGLTRSSTLKWSPTLVATNTYGTNAGDTTAPVNVNKDLTMGLTTDATKSGLIVDTTIPDGYNLYYYVGDTLQNASLINVARIEEKLVDKLDKDFELEYSTDWFTPTVNSTVVFDLTGTGFDLLTAEQKEKIKVHSLIKAIKDEAGFLTGDLIDSSHDNYSGVNANNYGFVSIIRSNTLLLAMGNNDNITIPYDAQFTYLKRANSLLKVTLIYKKD